MKRLRHLMEKHSEELEDIMFTEEERKERKRDRNEDKRKMARLRRMGGNPTEMRRN